jgi:hypothetical protein
MENQSEKRLHDRKAFNQPLFFEISALGEESKNIRQNGITTNISSDGFGMITDYSLKEGSVLKTYLPVQGVDLSIPVFTEVMWSVPNGNLFRVGLRFLA